jgi:crossover junction endodeoxyribonuclease RusA
LVIASIRVAFYLSDLRSIGSAPVSVADATVPRGREVEPEFPFEFIVPGTPVSVQRASKRARRAWKDLVRAASSEKLPEGHFATDRRLSVTMYYYTEERMSGDLDNIIKLTLDALSRHVFIDDSQI